MITTARDHFEREGYAILPDILSSEQLEILRHELDSHIAEADAEMDAAGTDMLGLNHRGKRYFVSNRMPANERLRSFVLGETMADVVRDFLGDDAWFFLEQFVVKLAEVGMTFSWHQDSGYLKQQIPDHERPYLTCWIALDDMTEENGTISVLPFSRGSYSGITEHVRDEATNDLVGYTGDDPGVPVLISAGSIAVFKTTLLHRSSANTTDKARRSYIVQYSAEPLLRPDGVPAINAIPFLVAGERVTR
jgi:ectoine hydroxylase-related dioxygenase (phytanoyl-CoA dioxygenase family)